MSKIKASILLSALAIGAVGLVGPQAQARDAQSVFTDIRNTAPRTIFDDIRDSAPRSPFDEIRDQAPRSDGVFGELERSAP
jgi:hypothetical protein